MKTLKDDLTTFQASVKKCSENLAEATSTYNESLAGARVLAGPRPFAAILLP